jgi:hypothetical protein
VIRANPQRTYARGEQSANAQEHLMAIPTRINHTTSRALAVIAERVLDDAHMTWVAAEIDSEHALRAWFDASAPQRAGAYLAYRAAVDREQAAAADLQRLAELIQPCQEGRARSE